jgi:phosphoribosylformimino-5-aminoimidazole carboxamide ribotide isomerase
MQIWPAIDLRDGKCVRLEQGDYQRETVFGGDPASMARQWVEQGAECLHLVDLDGARSGHVQNRASIQAIVEAVSVPCEVGGGIRDLETITDLLELGVARLIIGTKALKEPEWFRDVCRQFPGRLVLGIDALKGRVATDGWLKASEVSATRLASDLSKEPIAAIVYTDITTDGMLAGPNLEAMDEMRRAVTVPVIASGGVTTTADVAQLAQLGMAGCIVGRSLYEGRLSLPEAISVAREYSLR